MSCAACRLISSSSRFRITSMQHPLRTVPYPEPEISMGQPRNSPALPEAANDEIVPVRAVEAQHVDDRPACGGIDDLANAQQGIAAGDGENLRDSRIGGGGVNFLVCVAEFNLVIALENSKKRFPADGSVQQAREFSGVEIASLKGKGFTGRMTKTLEFDDLGRGWKRKASSGFIFIVEHFGEEHPGAGGEAAASHLLRVAHQFIKVNLGSSDKSSNTAAALDDAFAFEGGESVTRGHEADLVDFSEVAFGSDGVTGTQITGVNALPHVALNSRVVGQAVAVAVLQSHSLSRTSPGLR